MRRLKESLNKSICRRRLSGECDVRLPLIRCRCHSAATPSQSTTCLREVPGCQTHLGCVCAHCAGSTYTQTAIFGEASTREEPRRREPPGVASRRRPRPCHPRRSPTKTWLLSVGKECAKTRPSQPSLAQGFRRLTHLRRTVTATATPAQTSSSVLMKTLFDFVCVCVFFSLVLPVFVHVFLYFHYSFFSPSFHEHKAHVVPLKRFHCSLCCSNWVGRGHCLAHSGVIF